MEIMTYDPTENVIYGSKQFIQWPLLTNRGEEMHAVRESGWKIIEFLSE